MNERSKVPHMPGTSVTAIQVSFPLKDWIQPSTKTGRNTFNEMPSTQHVPRFHEQVHHGKPMRSAFAYLHYWTGLVGAHIRDAHTSPKKHRRLHLSRKNLSSKGVKAVGFRSSSLEGSRQTEEKDVRSDKHVLTVNVLPSQAKGTFKPTAFLRKPWLTCSEHLRTPCNSTLLTWPITDSHAINDRHLSTPILQGTVFGVDVLWSWPKIFLQAEMFLALLALTVWKINHFRQGTGVTSFLVSVDEARDTFDWNDLWLQYRKSNKSQIDCVLNESEAEDVVAHVLFRSEHGPTVSLLQMDGSINYGYTSGPNKIYGKKPDSMSSFLVETRCPFRTPLSEGKRRPGATCQLAPSKLACTRGVLRVACFGDPTAWAEQPHTWRLQTCCPRHLRNKPPKDQEHTESLRREHIAYSAFGLHMHISRL